MTIPLGEKQYELDGVLFGLGCPIEVMENGWTPGGADIQNGDTNRAGGDGIRFGKDRTRSATWGFELFTNAEDEEGAWDSIGELGTAWGADDIRTESGPVMPLRYRVAGRAKRVYGRPRRWTATPNNLSLGGRIDVVADFATVDHRVYDDELKELSVPIAPPAPVDAGVIPPFIPPIGMRQASSPRLDSMTVGGTVPTPLIVRVDGPVASARVQVGINQAQSDGTQKRIGLIDVRLVDPVAYDDPVTIDAQPWVVAATKRSGGGVRLNPRITRISKMWVPPGKHDVIFTGVDATAQAAVTLTWRNASRTPR